MTLRRNKVLMMVLTVVVISLIGWFSQFGWFQNNFSYIISPVGKVFAGISWWLHDKVVFLRQIGELKVKNQELFNENLKLKADLAQYQGLIRENDILRRELSLAPRQEHDLLAALVIGQQKDGYNTKLVINQGSTNGLQVGMPVVVGKGILLGRLVKVWPKTAMVDLIINNDFRVNAQTVRKRVKGIVEGEFGTNLIMKMILQNADIQDGDQVVTADLSSVLPPNLLIGEVKEVHRTGDQLFQEASLSSPIDFDDLFLVWVMRDFVPKE